MSSGRNPSPVVEIGQRQRRAEVQITQKYGQTSRHGICINYRGGRNEDEDFSPAFTRSDFYVRRSSLVDRDRSRRLCSVWRLLRRGSPAGAICRPRARIRVARVHVDSRILLPGRPALGVARGILGSSTVRGCCVGWAPLLWRPLLRWPLATPLSKDKLKLVLLALRASKAAGRCQNRSCSDRPCRFPGCRSP